MFKVRKLSCTRYEWAVDVVSCFGDRKLGRATDQDIGDIKALLRSGFILTTELRRLALQAIDV